MERSPSIPAICRAARLKFDGTERVMSTRLDNQDRIALTGLEKAVEIFSPYGKKVPASEPLSQKILDPTRQVCHELAVAFDFFNSRLFGNRLRPCLITLQRQRGAAGYFAAQRFETRDGTIIVDEIALNPELFHAHSEANILSTVVHEQVHALQAQYGHPSDGGYHNKEWADWMERIGLIPSDTEMEGGQKTGFHMSHYIQPDGPFARACADLIAQGIGISFVDRWAAMANAKPESDPAHDKRQARRKSKAASKSLFRCDKCGQSAWGKSSLKIDCRPCCQPMAAS